MPPVIELFLKLDKHLEKLTADYGGWTYAILFAIVFCETGLVVTPFLPGDSLLFAAGAIASLGTLDIGLLLVLLTVAAVLGDTVNYHLGKYLGPKVLRGEKSWLFNRKHLDRTHEFFERYGGKTIIIARFVPIVRTFAPFVAGVGSMSYRRFLAYNVIGGLIWVVGFTLAGYWFGQWPAVKRNFGLVIIGIIVISVLPAVFEFFRAKAESRRKAQSGDEQPPPPPTQTE
ncbi:MAG TPA: DedA family protein [Pirellulaceae bacterium]|nr:DedA family protein [Pirellulaceae bacterium]